jgi:hypothetical protein
MKGIEMNFNYKSDKTDDGRDILFINTPEFYIKSSFFRTAKHFEAVIELRNERIIVGMGGGKTAHEAIRNAIKEARKVKDILNKRLKGRSLAISDLIKRIKYWEGKMSEDYDNGKEGKYPPLYSKDYLFGKLKATRELIYFLKWYK